MFSDYLAFALLAAVILLEHGLPQAAVVRVLRLARRQLEAAHNQCLKEDPNTLFDERTIAANLKPGMITTDSTHPVFLAFVRLTGSAVDKQRAGDPFAVCRSEYELMMFIKKQPLGVGITFFEFARLIHGLAAHLSQTRAMKRGRRGRTGAELRSKKYRRNT